MLSVLLSSTCLSACLEIFQRAEVDERPVYSPGTSPNLAALVALRGAVEDGANDLAQNLLELLRQRRLSAEEEHLVDSFGRILAGRSIVEGLTFELLAIEVQSRLELHLRVSTKDGPLTLHVPPATVHHLRLAVDEAGLETRERTGALFAGLDGLLVPAGEALDLVLGDFDKSMGRALAIRDTWRLSLVSGEVLHATGTYPARDWPEPVCERTTLSPILSREPVTPEELSQRFLELLAEEPLPGPLLLSLGLRVEPERRGDALRALHAALQSSPAALPGPRASNGPEARVLSTLRWLARTTEPGVDLASWSAWLERWIQWDDQRLLGPGSAGLDIGAGGEPGTGGSEAAQPQPGSVLPPSRKRGLDLP